MEYLVGVVLALAVGVFAAAVGFDRDRSFFPVVLVIVGSCYVLFATMAPTGRPLVPEIMGASLFVVLAVIGFKRNLWLVVAGTVGHGVFDLIHHHVIEDSGVPAFWPGFCMAFDVVFGAWAALRLVKGGAPTGAARAGGREVS